MKAFYFVTDEACADVASAQAVWLTKLWSNVDIHLFIERRNRESSIREMRSPQIYYHYDKLSAFLPEGLPGSKAWPNVVYLRLFAPRLLKEYSRLCYLDSDVLCLHADPAFWEVPLQSGLGMVSDYDVHQNPPPDMSHMTRDAWLDAIGVSSGRYGNSGVLLIDPAVFSNYCVENALPEYFEKHPQANRYDQDFLNSYLDGQWTEFGPRLNYQAGLQSLGYERIIDPVFIHFCRHMKPWQKADPRWIAPSDPRFFEIYAQVFLRIWI
ncbi:Glycosyl transferase family 8 [Thioclava dalianensis]|uniref:glycosyltransferase family 8 protein n=1 Tax=Thioclava dalianensis TaxID=1185766 RepID=UPI0008F641B2|nr:glycosyltransferase [Thioclava dalianensis]SFM92219.1 Glycosyl transferase family 8 [Thioclava dalianensis]